MWNCVLCHFPNMDGQIDPFVVVVPSCVGNLQGKQLCWCVISVQKVVIWDV